MTISSQLKLLSRVMPAKITGVSPDDGWMEVEILGHASMPRKATLRMGWASFRNPDGAAWQRFIPSEGDIAIVGFDSEGRPYVLGYEPFAGMDGVGDGTVGWPAFNKFYERRFNDRPAWADFEPLRRGEWDMRSSGGVYLKGSSRGVLTLRGGGGIAGMRLDGPAGSISTSSSKTLDETGAVRVDVGEVRRTNATTGFTEQSAVPGTPVGHPQEWSVEVQEALPAPVRSVRVAAGTPAVYQETVLAPEPAQATIAPGEPLAFLVHRYPPGTVPGAPAPPLGAVEVSAAGNVGIKGTSVKIDGVATLLNTPAAAPGDSGVVREHYAREIATAATTAAAKVEAANKALLGIIAGMNSNPIPVVSSAELTAALKPVGDALGSVVTLLTRLQSLYTEPGSVSKTVHAGN